MCTDLVQRLLSVTAEGSTSSVQALLDQGLDVDSTDDNDNTALQVASANGHESTVRLLLMRGAALDKANSFGWTPLLLACRHGHANVAGILLQNKADINAHNRLGVGAMTLATRGGHLQVCRMLIDFGIDLSPSASITCSSCEFSPLMAAAHHGHDAVVRYLLDRSHDVNYRTPSTGMSALMMAALNGYMTTSQILIEKGADPNLTNVNEHTPLEIAMNSGKREVKGYLERKTTNKPKIAPEDIKPDIIEAAKKGDANRIREILEVDLTQRDVCSTQDGATPLMFASMTGRLDIAQILVEKGCDINKQDTVSCWTALMQATYHGKKAVAKYLINAGADVLIPAKNGCTAFDMASLIDDVDTELFRLLAASAMQVSPCDFRGKTWLSKASSTTALPTSSEQTLEEHPKTGLRAWWSRMSNRFRNLKLGRTFNMNTNRLAPLPSDSISVSSSNANLVNESSHAKNGDVRKSVSTDALGTTDSSQVSTITSYDTILMETRKNAGMYTLGMNAQVTTMDDGTLRPVIPPFLPPPTFESDRSKMPPSSSRQSLSSTGSATSTLTRKISPMKLLQNYSTSTQNLVMAVPSSPSASTKCTHSNSASPSSSTGASTLSGTNKSRVSSSASSSTLTAGSDTLNRSGNDTVFLPMKNANQPPGFLTAHQAAYTRTPVFVKPYSSSSYSSSTADGIIKASLHPRSRKASSKDTESTLTPSPRPPSKSRGSSSSGSKLKVLPVEQKTVIQPVEEVDELGGLLKNLELERYQPIFEEQEVDMEAFLTLSDQDLKELGIAHNEPRRQILTAITELNSGKGRERQQLQETMSEFNSSTMKSHQDYSDGQGESDSSGWSSREKSRSANTSDKSRSS